MKLLKVLGIALLNIFLIWNTGWSREESGAKPLRSILNKNGTLGIGESMSGSFDARGYRLASGPEEAPRFATVEEQGRVSLPRGGTTVLAAGDEHWDNRLGNFYANSAVMAIAISGTDIYIGGAFNRAGSVPANYIAKWNGSAWSALGSGTNNWIHTIAVIGADVYVGGSFTTAGSVPANYIAKWNGSAWSALGSGMNETVFHIAAVGTDVYATGAFTTAGGVAAKNIAKWNGSSWLALGSGVDDYISCIAASGTDVYVGGQFEWAGGVLARNVAKWNGSAWSALGGGLDNEVHEIAVSGTDVYVGGDFHTAGDAPANHVAKWDGSSWSALGSGMDDAIQAFALRGTDMYVGGPFHTAGGATANHIAKWDGSAWSVLGSGVNDSVSAIAVSGTDVYVGGWFKTAGGKPYEYFCRWREVLPKKKADFNGDGQEDILWRFYGGGPWQGKNAVWYLSQAGGDSIAALGMTPKVFAQQNLFPEPGPNKIHWSPLEAGGLFFKRPEKIRQDALEAADILKYKGEWKIDAADLKEVRIVRNPGEIGMGNQGRIKTAGLVTLGSAYLETVADLNWGIAGIGDFNGDGKTDILWRYYGSGSNQGKNVVWYLNGVNYIGADWLMTITDTHWRIESTGDFNGDGETDILWRYYGGGPDQGKNVVWYMNGVTRIGGDWLITVTDPNWQIEGTGDFNGDGITDILWRYYGGGSNQGKNAVWYMNGANYIGSDMLITVTDTNWRIQGTGDFNGDGKTDIIWRYFGGDSNLGKNAVWYMNGANYIGAAMLDTVADANWYIKNR